MIDMPTPTTLSVKDARNSSNVGCDTTLRGWIRTRRDSKGGFSFLELNDGSCLANIQIVADANLPNYESEVKKLSPGCSVSIRGEVKPSGGKAQDNKGRARENTGHGRPAPGEKPQQRRRNSVEGVRRW